MCVAQHRCHRNGNTKPKKRAAVGLQIHMTKRENLYGKETCEKFTDALSVKRLPLS